MNTKKKISSNPYDLTFHSLQILAKDLKIEDWQNKSRDEIIQRIEEIAEYDKNKEQIEKLFDLVPGGFKPIGEIWLDLFYKTKLWTSIITAALAIAIALIVYYSDLKYKQQTQKQRIENLEITKQIDNLNKVEINLKTLIEFVKQQKTNLNQTEQKIQSLSKEKDELEPIVNTNRDLIQAIFRQQNEFNKKNIWMERLIGFGSGILGSIIASIIFNLFRRQKAANLLKEKNEEFKK